MSEQVGTLCEMLKELTLEQQVLTICPGSASAFHCKMQIVPPLIFIQDTVEILCEATCDERGGAHQGTVLHGKQDL